MCGPDPKCRERVGWSVLGTEEVEAAGFLPRDSCRPLCCNHPELQKKAARPVGLGGTQGGWRAWWLHRDRPRPTLAAASVELVKPARVPGDRFAVGWGLLGC